MMDTFVDSGNRFTWWLPALPFTYLTFVHDELRKWWIRRYPDGWVAKECFY